MNVGIVGMPSSGKTTLFRALTRGTVKTNNPGRANIGVVSVPDARIDYFTAQYKPKKITYAAIEFIDGTAKIEHGEGHTKFGSDFFADVRQVDALVHVVRGFEDATLGKLAPVQDFRKLTDELTLSDLQMVENRMQRVEKQTHGVKKGAITPATVEMDLLTRLHETLEAGLPISNQRLTPEEEKTIRGYDFLTLKPVISVLNVSEESLGVNSETAESFLRICSEAGVHGHLLCAELEMEVSQLPEDEELEFLETMNVSEPARNVLIRECYDVLGLISFITAGEPEVRAWTAKTGTRVVDAAGTIHSDLARGFIRAEVANYSDIKTAGSWESAKQKGIVQLHGKEYIVQDGDVLYIRFKV